ncbi:MAG: hypothetical protein JRG75_05705 [Deltaproteobacteria bacterium]|nr:hypothetical protein [Deltaproteobacteria bacterium]
MRILVLIFLLLVVLATCWWPKAGEEANGFPGSFSVSSRISKLTGGKPLESYAGVPADSKPLPAIPMPSHPFLNNRGYAGAHADSYNSGVQPHAGPLGVNPVVHSRMVSWGFGGCSTQAFDSKGRIISSGVGFLKSRLVLLDPKDLAILATETLPFFSGWYIRLDDQGRIIIPTGDQAIRIYEIREKDSGPSFSLVNTYDLSEVIPEEGQHRFLSNPFDVVPDWNGNLWFAIFRPAIVGYVDPDTGKIHSMILSGEILENGLCASRDGVFFVTDHHLYGMREQPGKGQPEVFLKFEYERGSGIKALSRGSGTTPVLFGGGSLIAFGDNAEPRPNVLVYRLDDVEDSKRLVCKVPVFEPGQSALENSFIGYGRSLIVENNYGFSVFGDSSGGAPGLVRIDVREDLCGCDIVWQNDLVASGCGAKLSTGNGLIYQYSLETGTGWVNAWYFTAVDFETGNLVWKIYAGSGKQWDNAMLTLSIGQNGELTAGLVSGLASLRDGQSRR